MKISLIFDLIRNMGLKYILFRASYEIIRKSGLLKKSFPVKQSYKEFISLEQWKLQAKPFFFSSPRNVPKIELDDFSSSDLSDKFHNLQKGTLKMFSGLNIETAFCNWHQNPDNGFIFNPEQHWTEINEFAPGQGDIKFVWEKGRFCFLYTIIRYDHQNKTDHGDLVFSLILSWISKNKLNCGPHFKCSQEIAIRILNWIFALYYYRDSVCLNKEIFGRILNSIYYQALHIDKNLKFASIAVRNNHIISEALGLYTVGILFPWFKESKKWKANGKNILEREGLYQIYPDGSYLQHSFNYQRVVLQLYTWAFRISEVNNDPFSNKLTTRMQLCVNFLNEIQNEYNGLVPNYGANDGSLFFPLNSCSYNDYRPQINALNVVLSKSSLYEKGIWNEDLFWYGINCKDILKSGYLKNEILEYKTGGYFILKTNEMKAFIRCASFLHRPSHSDNLHLDLWYKGFNIICDRGSFSYNTDPEILAMFLPTNVHNTVSISDYDQMLKGPRFIWYYWPESIYHKTINDDGFLQFSGAVKAFRYLNKNGIIHHRTIKQYKHCVKWEIIDKIDNWNGEMIQYWNIGDKFNDCGFSIVSSDGNGTALTSQEKHGLYSETYGIRNEIKQISFKTKCNLIHTIIEKK